MTRELPAIPSSLRRDLLRGGLSSEVIEEIREAFYLFDEKGSNFIHYQIALKALTGLGCHIADEQINETYLTSISKTKNSFLNFEEFAMMSITHRDIYHAMGLRGRSAALALLL